jgi:hypothetical protein
MEFSEQFKVYVRSINKVKTTNVVKPKKLSGYNLYCQEMRANLTGTSIEIMKQLGEKWKGASAEEKKKYKEKADKLNETAVAEAKSVPTTNDDLVEELKTAINELIKKFKKDVKKRAKSESEAAAPAHVEVPAPEPEVEKTPEVVEKAAPAPKKRVVKKKEATK